ncbi:MAG: hypothetical protein WA733_23980, partial [Methylocystis sp.]
WSSFFVIAKARKNQIPTPFLTRESRHDSQKSSRNRKIFRLSVPMTQATSILDVEWLNDIIVCTLLQARHPIRNSGKTSSA